MLTPLFAAIFLFLSLLISFPMTLNIIKHSSTFLYDWQYYTSMFPFHVTIILDSFSMIFFSTVLYISMNVMLFSKFYMHNDLFMPRFIALVMLFVFSMVLLIFIPNLVTLLLGWDGLGLSSFLLVIYYQNSKSLAAGMVTALTNRIGDVLILISIAYMINSHWSLASIWVDSTNIYLALMLTIAATTKSAQIPFSSWLPAAMAAPTPVSALVHSSTLVTAGIYLIFRFYPLMEQFYYVKSFLLISASMTAIMSGLSAMTECDMKKIIALSTLSQLSVMMISLGINAPVFAFFHLITHALFKALMFLAAGTLIHFHLHSQDLRLMGNIVSSMPFTSSMLIISNLALMGTPFLAGFYSKDAILEFALTYNMNMIFLLLFFTATGLTSMYAIRFLINTSFSSRMFSPAASYETTSIFILMPMLLLSMGAIFVGAALNWVMLIPMAPFIMPSSLKYLTLIIIISSLCVSYLLSYNESTLQSSLLNMPFMNSISCQMWFMSALSTQGMINFPMNAAHMNLKYLDGGWHEMLGGQGFYKFARISSAYMKSISYTKTPTLMLMTLISYQMLILVYYIS